MLSPQPQVFHWRQVGAPAGARKMEVVILPLLLLVAFMAVAGWLVWKTVPPERLAAVDGAKLMAALGSMAAVTLPALAPMLLVGLAVAVQRRARLLLDANTLRYQCGWRWCGRWLDWTLNLDELRRGAVSWQLISGPPVGPYPLAQCELTWGPGGRRRIQLAAWALPGQHEAARPRPESFLGLVRWQSPANQALLLQQFDDLPLVQALRAQGLVLPSFSTQRQVMGVDLMAYPRMKAVVFGFFGGVLAAALLFHLVRSQHYVVAPPWGLWAGAGVFTALLAGGWLWRERPAQVLRRTEMAGFRFHQVILALLAGVALGLCAPSLPLLWGVLAQPARMQAFEVRPLAPMNPRVALVARDAPDVPVIEPDQAIAYWLSLPAHTPVVLPVRRGPGGLWWQFDSSVLNGRVQAFYDAGGHR